MWRRVRKVSKEAKGQRRKLKPKAKLHLFKDKQEIREKMAPAVPVKKVKKSQENINSRLALAIKSGKFFLGYKSTLKSIRQGKGMLCAFED